MSALRVGAVSLMMAIYLVGCSIIPQIPHESQLPVGEIVLNATCDLKFALEHLDQRKFARFKARFWLISIALLPKVDAEVAVGAGYSGKSSSVSPAYLSTWVIGAAPGIQVDSKGERSSAVTYKINSADLIDDKQLDCYNSSPTFNALTNNLGVQDWLVRTAIALNSNPVATVDSPTYNSEITIKFNGDGSYSYAFPFGGALASASGNYSVDEQLQISMTPLTPPPKPYQVTTLPVPPLTSDVRNAASVSAAAATQRLDILQLQNTLRSLRAVQ